MRAGSTAAALLIAAVSIGCTAAPAATPTPTAAPTPTPRIEYVTKQVTVEVTPKVCRTAIMSLVEIFSAENDMLDAFLDGEIPSTDQTDAFLDLDIEATFDAVYECLDMDEIN